MEKSPVMKVDASELDNTFMTVEKAIKAVLEEEIFSVRSRRRVATMAMAIEVGLFAASERLDYFVQFGNFFGHTPEWMLDQLHEREVHFRQTLRHENLEDLLSLDLAETSWATGSSI